MVRCNDGDYTDDLLIEMDKILNFFVEKNIDKSKVIFMTSNLNLNYGLSNLQNIVKRGYTINQRLGQCD